MKLNPSTTAALLATAILPLLARADWPQAAGPHHNYVVTGDAPTTFSVATGHNVRWRTPLPNTGESTPIIVNNRVFVTCHTEMTADRQAGRDVYGICFDAATGEERWRRRIPGTRETDMASGFSDNTAASPLATDKLVAFVNVGGAVHVYDHDGNRQWQHQWVPFGRHHARQQEPILHDGKLIFLKTVATDLPVAATTKTGAKPLGRDKKYWTRLHAFDLATGKPAWIAESATSVHAASMLGRTPDGTMAILTGRGGGHQPPEEPYGLSLIRADTGKTIWDLPIAGYAAHQNCTWSGRLAPAIIRDSHHLVEISTGKLQKGFSLTKAVDLTRFAGDRHHAITNADLPTDKKRRAITYHTNLLVGDYHYFRSHKGYLLGRTKLSNGKAEYLQVPVQVVHKGDAKRLLWDKAIPNDCKNSQGFVVNQDKRAALDGWGHVSAASPIVVGDYLYLPTMVGTVYVVAWNAPTLNQSALVSISDLGPAGKTWSLSSLAFANGNLYARTMKELICIAKPKKKARTP